MRTLIFALSWLVCAGVFALPGLAAADANPTDPHPFTARDLHGMHRLSEPQPSPQGDTVVFVLRSTDFAANRGRTHLVRVGIDGGGLTPLTEGDSSESSPYFTADGKSLYFLSTRGGSSQVWRLDGPSAGAQPVQVTHLPLDVGSFRLAPDGRHLVVSLEVFVDCPTLACTKERLDQRAAKGQPSGQLYDQLFVRHWDTWSNGTRSHLFALPVTGGGGGGEPVDLTRGLDADVPSKPDGGAEEYHISPDSRSVVYTARTANREEPWSTNFDLFEVALDGSTGPGAPKNLTAANLAWDAQPLFSPDGKTLAYLAMTRAGFEADRFRIVLLSLADGRSRVLTEAWDRSPGELLFSPDGKTLYCTAMDVGQVGLFAVDVATGKVRTVVRRGSVHAPAWVSGRSGGNSGARDGKARLVFGLDDLSHPVDLYTVRPDGSDLKKITDVNRAELAAVRMGEPQPFQFAGAKGDTVHGFIVKPAGFDASKRYPVAFLIHGGPQGSFHDEFHYRWNPQVYAGAGYAVIQIDFHGSTGYGQAFTDAITGHWGDWPLEDLQKGLAAALAANSWMDGERVGALGASYGGFMTNWIAGNWPDRFRCLVTHDGIFDQRMLYYSTEEMWFPEWEMGGPYWKNPETYERWNPVHFVERWKTPMLIVHGALDFRIPMTQGLAAFTALERRGIPSRFLYFPDENHFVLKPANALLWHETVLAWLDRWLKPAPTPAGSASR
jgi:dipeptidyl aminopeptidase/acylaminoacyl peptidase